MGGGGGGGEEEGGGDGGAKRVGKERVRRLCCIHELAHTEPLILYGNQKLKLQGLSSILDQKIQRLLRKLQTLKSASFSALNIAQFWFFDISLV